MDTIPRSVARQLNLAGLAVRENLLGRLSIRRVSATTTHTRPVSSLSALVFPLDGEVLLLDDTKELTSKAVNHRVFLYNKPINVVAGGALLYRVGSKLMQTYKLEKRPHPIGQLDKHTTGMLLFSSSGDISNWINLPGNTPKTYIVTYFAPKKTRPTENQCKTLLSGVDVTRKAGLGKRAEVVKASSVNLLSIELLSQKSSTHVRKRKGCIAESFEAAACHKTYSHRLELTINSGSNHVIKRMMQAIGFPPVRKLRRVKIGNLSIEKEFSKDFHEGCYRELSKEECAAVGCPTDDDLLELKLCQLLCRCRSSYSGNEEDSQRLREYLASKSVPVDGSEVCFSKFPSLTCHHCQ